MNDDERRTVDVHRKAQGRRWHRAKRCPPVPSGFPAVNNWCITLAARSALKSVIDSPAFN